jgi:thiamine-monophosphate kinase
VTGTIGDAVLGLALRKPEAPKWNLSDAQRKHLVSRYLLPQPRNALAEAVRTHASAAMDVSDGLAGDFAKLCRTSGVAARIDVGSVPLSEAAKAVISANAAMLETALSGGDDYEIVCTVPRAKADSFCATAKEVGVGVTDIGEVMAGSGTKFETAEGKAFTFARASFSHF